MTKLKLFDHHSRLFPLSVPKAHYNNLTHLKFQYSLLLLEISYFVRSNFKLDNVIRRASATSLEGPYFHYQKKNLIILILSLRFSSFSAFS